MDHDAARCAVFGVDTIDELASVFPSMSLKKQGWLDKPSCRMLLVNGKDDAQTPIADLYSCWNTAAQNRLACSRRTHGPDSTNLDNYS